MFILISQASMRMLCLGGAVTALCGVASYPYWAMADHVTTGEILSQCFKCWQENQINFQLAAMKEKTYLSMVRLMQTAGVPGTL